MLKELPRPFPRRLSPRSKAVFHRQEPPIHQEQGRGSGSTSKVCTCRQEVCTWSSLSFTCTGSQVNGSP